LNKEKKESERETLQGRKIKHFRLKHDFLQAGGHGGGGDEGRECLRQRKVT